MHFKKSLAIPFLLLLLITTASAGGYTVSPDGTGADYSMAKAQAYANSHTGEEITFLLASGEYGEVNFNDAISRTGWDKGVTWKAAPGEIPVFTKLTISGDVNRYIEFNGISIVAPGVGWATGGVGVVDSDYVRLINLDIQGTWLEDYSGVSSGGIGIRASAGSLVNNILIEGNEIKDFDLGIFVNYAGDNVVIRNNHIQHMMANGISLWEENEGTILVENNHIHNQDPAPSTHGSGLTIRASNIIARGNIIHDFGNTRPIRTYGTNHLAKVPGKNNNHNNMLFENNLVYDALNWYPVEFLFIGDNFVFRNNTVIGKRGSNTYGTALRIEDPATNPASGASFSMHDNILVGKADIYFDKPYLFKEGNNIIFEHSKPTLTGELTNTKIIKIGGVVSDEDYFEKAGNFFSGGSDPDLFNTYSYTYPDPAYYPSTHKQNLNDAYVPMLESDACNAQGIITKGHLTGQPCAGQQCEVKAECSDTFQCKTLVDCVSQQCIYSDKVGSCSDGDACTLNDTCSSGTCQGTQKNCNDSFPCTTDSCSGGNCINTPNDNACGTSTTCTTYTCTGTGCQTTYNIGATCNDGIDCTQNDLCNLSGACHGTTQDSQCPYYPDCTNKTCTLTGCVYTPAGCAIPPDLVMYMPFEGNIQDNSGNNNHGTCTSCPTLTEDRQGNQGSAYSFDGTNDFIDVVNSPSLDITDEITLAAWIKPATVGQSAASRVISKRNTSGGSDVYALGLYSNVENPFTRIISSSGSKDLIANGIAPIGQWTHIAATYNGSYMRIYINGIENKSTAKTGNIETSTINLHIGDRANEASSRRFNGSVDEVRIYNRALTSQEILALYNQTEQQCVSTPTLLNHISNWKQGSLGMLSLMQKLEQWKAGTGC